MTSELGDYVIYVSLDQGWKKTLSFYAPRRRGTLSDTAIRPSVSLSQPRLYIARWLRGAAAARWLPAVNS